MSAKTWTERHDAPVEETSPPPEYRRPVGEDVQRADARAARDRMLARNDAAALLPLRFHQAK